MFPLSGEIQGMTAPWLFHDIRKTKKTGTVFFEQTAETIKVFFKQGDVIFASSNSDNDSLGELLLRTGKITQQQLEKASTIAAKSGKNIGAVLFEIGALQPQELVDQTKLRARRNILSLFKSRQGRYRFDGGALSGAEIVPLPMSTSELILEGVRSLDWQEIRTSLPPLNTIIQKPADPAPLFQSTQLDQPERAILSLVDGSASIQDICGLSRLGDLRTLSALYVLLALRVLLPAGTKDQTEKEFTYQEERPNLAPAEIVGPDSATESLINRELLKNAYNSLDLHNYYEILGVGHSATPYEIKKAYTSLYQLYHPDRQTNPQLADIRLQLKTLVENINEAYQVLRVKEKRDQYNIDLASGTKKYGQEEQQPANKEEADKAAAEVLFNEGMKQMHVQNFWGAEESFRGATRLVPSKAVYIFHQGLAIFRLPRRSHEAEEYFLKAIELAPSRIEYYLELGNFYTKTGLKGKALVQYQKALKRDPNSEKVKQAIKAAGG
jgi:curved DNA-binding protein CbpA